MNMYIASNVSVQKYVNNYNCQTHECSATKLTKFAKYIIILHYFTLVTFCMYHIKWDDTFLKHMISVKIRKTAQKESIVILKS